MGLGKTVQVRTKTYEQTFVLPHVCDKRLEWRLGVLTLQMVAKSSCHDDSPTGGGRLLMAGRLFACCYSCEWQYDVLCSGAVLPSA